MLCRYGGQASMCTFSNTLGKAYIILSASEGSHA